MKDRFLIGSAAALMAAGLLTACDNSRQTADGTTQAGDAGTAAAAGNGTIADTGSPGQGGGGGTPSGKGVSGGMTTDANGNPPSQETPVGSEPSRVP